MEVDLEDQKRRRVQLSKEEKRVMAEASTVAAFADNEQRRKERDEKTARLRALRLAKEDQGQGLH
jgi:hypothetical protein